MRDLIFIECDESAAEQAETWAGAALARAGMTEGEAAEGARRLAEGVRAAARAFAAERPAGAAPKAMLALHDLDGKLSFELVADGHLRGRKGESACCDAAWQRAHLRAPGDGAVALSMAACA